jgi:hypothetical protein
VLGVHELIFTFFFSDLFYPQHHSCQFVVLFYFFISLLAAFRAVALLFHGSLAPAHNEKSRFFFLIISCPVGYVSK